MSIARVLCILPLGLAVSGVAVLFGDEKAPVKAAPRPLTRLFVQDLQACSLKWADVLLGPDGKLTLGPVAEVPGFPKLDPARQKLVQMQESGSLVCVGVRDDAHGQFQSGWVLVQTGVGYSDHGDHGHWAYKKSPQVVDSRLGTDQGNPAHLYCYSGKFFVANDALNGYTRIDPAKYATNEARTLGKGTPRFLAGGGNHITLAVVEDKVGYACWIDGGGPNQGRVDVTPITTKDKTEPAYSFYLPSGGIHGATHCCGKVFFAPAAGICWVEADTGLKLKADQVKVRHIDLGSEGDTPRRTGSFHTLGRYVLFVTGKQAPQLVILDAQATEPQPRFVPLTPTPGTTALLADAVTTVDGKPYAFVFHDRKKDAEAADRLEIVALDPNGDGRFDDARPIKTLTIGASAVEGHFGHHDLAFDADRRFGFFTNPGDGTIAVLSLKTFEVVATYSVGGKPAAIVARGGEDPED